MLGVGPDWILCGNGSDDIFITAVVHKAFVDVNEDGYDDVIFSDPDRYGLHLFVSQPFLGFQAGWSREVLSGKRGEAAGLPRVGPRGGACGRVDRPAAAALSFFLRKTPA